MVEFSEQRDLKLPESQRPLIRLFANQNYALPFKDNNIEIYTSGYEFFPVMAAIGEGTRELINRVAARLQTLPPVKRYESEPAVREDYTKPKTRSFKIRVCDGVYIVEDAPWLLDIMNDINPEDYESLQYFERVLRSSGIIDALIKNGIAEGDTVSVYDVEFDYVE